MNIYGILVVLHLLGACVWVGGHLVLACSVLPQALKVRDSYFSYRIESGYDLVGLPALALQVSTGLVLAYLHLPDLGEWLALDSPMGRLIAMKLGLLFVTLFLGIDLRYRLLRKIETRGPAILKWHVVLITFVSVGMVFLGASFRIGWLY